MNKNKKVQDRSDTCYKKHFHQTVVQNTDICKIAESLLNYLLNNSKSGSATFDKTEGTDCPVVKIRGPQGASVWLDMLAGDWF